MSLQNNYFCIAEMYIKIAFRDININGMGLIPSFEPFRTSKPTNEESIVFELIVDDQLKPIAKEYCENIKTFDTGNGDTIVDSLSEGGCQFIIKNIHGHSCCLLQIDKTQKKAICALNGNYNMRCFGLNNALMIGFAFATSKYKTILIHSSLVRNNGYGYAFTAKSGTGKSTQVSMWLRYIKGSDLMNDDNPVIRIMNDIAYIYGSPWSGKTPCYRNIKAKLGAITLIDRAEKNSVEQLKPIEAFATILEGCSSMKWDKEHYNNVCNTITRLIELSNIYVLHCLPNEEAAQVCYKHIAVKPSSN